jgi:6-phosphogluconate dehydrogenase
MVERLMQGGYDIVTNDPVELALKKPETKGAFPAGTLEAMAEKLEPPRAVWVMALSGRPPEETLVAVSAVLAKRDRLFKTVGR